MLASEKDNVVGAIVFFLYILAALCISGVIIKDVLKACTYNFPIKGHESTLYIYAAIAAFSFSTLSYHMLSFLILSYEQWNRANRLPRITPYNLQLWAWSTSSQLFLDFAKVIINEPHNFWWTQLALLYGFGWNMYMSIQGTRYQVPNLWAFFVLDQILPVSFSQSLFILTLLTLPKDRQASSSNRDPRKMKAQLVNILCFIASLVAAPKSIETAYFLPVYLLGRFLLFAPLLSFNEIWQQRSREVTKATTSVWFDYRHSFILFLVLAFGMQLAQTLRMASLHDVRNALNTNPAVGTVGYDVLIAVGSLMTVMALETSTSHWNPLTS